MKLISLSGASLAEVQKQNKFEFRSIFRSLISRESKFFSIALLIFMVSVNLASAVEIKVWRFGGILAEHSWEKKKITEWNNQNPDVKVVWSNQDWATKREKVISSFKARQLPDILVMDGPSIPDFVRLGVIQALDDVDSNMVGSWKNRFVPEIWNTTIYKGKFYAIPTYVDVTTFLTYNKAFVKTPPTTWQELKNVAKNLKGKSNKIPVVIAATKGTNDVNLWEGIAYANGCRWLNEKGDKVVINDRGCVDALQLYKDLVTGGLTEDNPQEIDYYKAIVLLLEESAIMSQSMSWLKAIDSEVKGSKNPDYGLTVFPKNANPTGSYPSANVIMAPTSAGMLTSQSKNVKAAMKFLNYFASQEFQAGWDGDPIPGRVPATRANWASPDVVKVYPDLVKLYNNGTLFKGALPMPAFPGLVQMESYMGEALQSVVMGQQNVQSALDRVAKKSQKVLNKVSN
jgi:multiple sugar transport system substrate-binding protein